MRDILLFSAFFFIKRQLIVEEYILYFNIIFLRQKKYEMFPYTFFLVISSKVIDADYNLSLHKFIWRKWKFLKFSTSTNEYIDTQNLFSLQTWWFSFDAYLIQHHQSLQDESCFSLFESRCIVVWNSRYVNCDWIR